MKVLVFTSLFPNAVEPGKGIFIKERMRHVARLCEIKVVAPIPYFPPIKLFKHWYKYSQVPAKEIIDGLEVYHPRYFVTPKIGMIFYGFWLFLGSLKTVKSIYRDFCFDLIDTHYIYPDGYAAVLLSRKFNKPIVVSARGTDINLYPKFTLIKKRIIYTLENATKVISVCQSLKNKMIELGISSKKIEVVPNGVDIERFKLISKVQAREELNLPCDKKIILSVGHLVERKGFHYLIDAISEIKNNAAIDKMPMLIIIGEGVYRSKLENQIKKLNLEESVRLIGAKSHHELYKWYSAADLFCLASSREGWPNVIFESLACGLPVVATNVNGVPEVICSNEYGMLIESRNSMLFAKAIIEGSRKKWNTEKIINYAQENTWDKVAQKVFFIFQTIKNKRVLGEK